MLYEFYLAIIFNEYAITASYALSLHDALPISAIFAEWVQVVKRHMLAHPGRSIMFVDEAVTLSEHAAAERSEEHTSELQSQSNLVCRLLLEKKKNLTQIVDFRNMI